MAAPLESRGALMALYAFNVEIARAPWVASEPLLARIRLQWWTDAIEEIFAGDAPRRHEVVEPLAETIRRADLPRILFLETIEARLFDAEPGPFEDVAALDRHVDRTAGHLMELAARVLAAPQGALGPVRDLARGAGLASFLEALPRYAARGHRPLPDDIDTAALARAALARIEAARADRARVPADLLPALLPGVLAAPWLRRYLSAPHRAPGLSEFERRARFAAVALTGRW